MLKEDRQIRDFIKKEVYGAGIPKVEIERKADALRVIVHTAKPGVLIGRKGGDRMGGGLTQSGLLSRGINTAGDVDGDGQADIFASSVLASPEGKTDAGEVYLMYGFAPPVIPPQ